MSSPEYSSQWYFENRERLLEVRRAYNKEYSKRPYVIEKAKAKNARPDQKLNRKLYKKTETGRDYEKNRRSKPVIKNKLENWRLKSRYGITLEQYEQLFNLQGGRCAICDRETDHTLHVDHCHETGLVRGLLCGSCNRGLGMYGDNVQLLRKAADYLEDKNG